MKRIAAALLIAAFLGSCLAAPMALAAEDSSIVGETLIGVVTRGWTTPQCEAEFGVGIVTAEPKDDPLYSLDHRGPLKSTKRTPPIQTGCFCTAQPTGQGDTHAIMNAEGTKCEFCNALENDAVHLADEELKPLDLPDAVIKSVGKDGEEVDRGCRCRQKENHRFLGVVDGDCKYVESSTEDAACTSTYAYGDDGSVISCPEGAGADKRLGTAVTKDGISVQCCCAEGSQRVPERRNVANPFTCKKLGEGVTANGALCQERAKTYSQAGDGSGLAECLEEFVNGQPMSPEVQKDKTKRYITAQNPFGKSKEGYDLYCCCATGYTWDAAGGKCVSEDDACTEAVKGSVLSTNPARDLNYPITGAYSEPGSGKSWSEEVIKSVTDANIECYCKQGFAPFGDPKFTGCAKLAEENIVLLVKTPQQFISMFKEGEGGGLFNALSASGPSATKTLDILCVVENVCDGVVIGDAGTLSFEIHDPSRKGRIVAMVIGGIAESLAFAPLAAGLSQLWGKLGIKSGKKMAAEFGEAALKGAVRSADDVAGTIKAVTKPEIANNVGVLDATKLKAGGAEAAKHIGDVAAAAAEKTYMAVGKELLKAGDVAALMRVLRDNDDLAVAFAKHFGAPLTAGKTTANTFKQLETLLVKAASSPIDADISFVGRTVGKAYKVDQAVSEEVAKQAYALAKPNTYLDVDTYASLFKSGATFLTTFTGATGSVALDDLAIPAETARKLKSTRFKDIMLAALIGGVGGAAMGVFGGGISAIPGFFAGAILSAVNEAATGEADKAEMYIKWDGNPPQREGVLNLLVADNPKTCGKLTQGATSSFPTSAYPDTSVSLFDLDTWYLTGIAVTAVDCGFFEGGGGFMVTTLDAAGGKISCKGCSNDLTSCKLGTAAQDRYTDKGKLICCQSCTMGQEPLLTYSGMPSQTVAPSEGGALVIG